MCKVSTLKDAKKRVGIIMNNGENYFSEWFMDTDEEGNKVRTERSVYRDTLDAFGADHENVKEWFIQRMREDSDTVYISDHAMECLKQRNGWSKKASIRMIKKVYDNGLSPDKVRGTHASWVRHKEETKNHGDTLRLYGDFLYVFNKNTLITIMHTPTKGSFYNPAYREAV